MTYVRCHTGAQTCGEPHPTEPWRTCVQFKNHHGKHYVPPVTRNYEYWESE